VQINNCEENRADYPDVWRPLQPAGQIEARDVGEDREVAKNEKEEVVSEKLDETELHWTDDCHACDSEILRFHTLEVLSVVLIELFFEFELDFGVLG